MDEVKTRVIGILGEILNVPLEDLGDADKFTDLKNWDSLYHLNVVLGIEREFGTSFDVEEVMLISSITSAVELIRKKLVS